MPQLQLIGLALVGVLIASLVAAVLWFRSEAHDEKALRLAKERDLAQAVDVNKTNIAVIDRLKQQKKTDDATVAELSRRVSEISERASEQTRTIAKLQRKNHDVEAYLAAPIPAELARVLNASVAGYANRARRKSGAADAHRTVSQAAH